MENKTTLYGAIKREAAARDAIPALLANHSDMERDYNLHNHAVNDLIRDYKAAGGRRDVSAFQRKDLKENSTRYSVKPEYIDRWTNEAVDELIVTADEIADLANGWSVTIEELMEQVEGI